ncbi:nuA3 HAT complex component nto1 [Perkinsus olseni]|uniref:NuA3 HAT complex component nto1 n=1 Tax=Perkinsus olseni TaxID=32597 RepID=A0A7J6P9F0_PEROL|nr:nuA3 HAT complex component nto1 [Perkinsus olseni]
MSSTAGGVVGNGGGRGGSSAAAVLSDLWTSLDTVYFSSIPPAHDLLQALQRLKDNTFSNSKENSPAGSSTTIPSESCGASLDSEIFEMRFAIGGERGSADNTIPVDHDSAKVEEMDTNQSCCDTPHRTVVVNFAASGGESDGERWDSTVPRLLYDSRPGREWIMQEPPLPSTSTEKEAPEATCTEVIKVENLKDRQVDRGKDASGGEAAALRAILRDIETRKQQLLSPVLERILQDQQGRPNRQAWFDADKALLKTYEARPPSSAHNGGPHLPSGPPPQPPATRLSSRKNISSRGGGAASLELPPLDEAFLATLGRAIRDEEEVPGPPDGQEAEVDLCCSICGDGDVDDDNAILICDGCHFAAHQKCYGVSAIPEQEWFCRTCSVFPRDAAGRPAGERPVCVLCGRDSEFVGGGLMKPAVVSMPGKGSSGRSAGWKQIHPSRRDLVCGICKSRVGAKVQCAFGKCQNFYHVSCAARYGLVTEGTGGNAAWVIYCPRHSRQQQKQGNAILARLKAWRKSEHFNRLSHDKFLAPFDPRLVTAAGFGQDTGDPSSSKIQWQFDSEEASLRQLLEPVERLCVDDTARALLPPMIRDGRGDCPLLYPTQPGATAATTTTVAGTTSTGSLAKVVGAYGMNVTAPRNSVGSAGHHGDYAGVLYPVKIVVESARQLRAQTHAASVCGRCNECLMRASTDPDTNKATSANHSDMDRLVACQNCGLTVHWRCFLRPGLPPLNVLDYDDSKLTSAMYHCPYPLAARSQDGTFLCERCKYIKEFGDLQEQSDVKTDAAEEPPGRRDDCRGHSSACRPRSGGSAAAGQNPSIDKQVLEALRDERAPLKRYAYCSSHRPPRLTGRKISNAVGGAAVDEPRMLPLPHYESPLHMQYANVVRARVNSTNLFVPINPEAGVAADQRKKRKLSSNATLRTPKKSAKRKAKRRKVKRDSQESSTPVLAGSIITRDGITELVDVDDWEGSCPKCGVPWDPNDPGQLIGCDECDEWYHMACVGLISAPEGKWFCPNCSKAKTPSRKRSQGHAR